MPKEQNIYQSLSYDIIKNVTAIEDREIYIKEFLHKRLPNSDVNSIPDELRKKHKAKLIKTEKTKPISFYANRKSILLSLNNVLLMQKLKYKDIIPLHNLWLGYMKQLLGVTMFSEIKDKMNPSNSNYENFTQHIMRADYHGAKISVLDSKCSTLVGIKGIIIVETKNIFQIINEKDRIISIPKDQCTFSMHLKDITLNVEGKDICIRPAERSVKKFKCSYKV